MSSPPLDQFHPTHRQTAALRCFDLARRGCRLDHCHTLGAVGQHNHTRRAARNRHCGGRFSARNVGHAALASEDRCGMGRHTRGDLSQPRRRRHWGLPVAILRGSPASGAAAPWGYGGAYPSAHWRDEARRPPVQAGRHLNLLMTEWPLAPDSPAR